MIKLYSAIQGKKLSLIGTGDTLAEAIYISGIERDEDYVRAAHSDWVIVDEQTEYVNWCVANNLAPNNANSLRKYMEVSKWL